MNQRLSCFNHPDQVAVAVCKTCGKGLCSVCTDKYTLQLCDKCLLANNEQVRDQLKKRQRKYTVALVLGLIAGLALGIGVLPDVGGMGLLLFPAIYGYFFPSVVAGFYAVPKFNVIFGKLLRVPIAGWAVLLIVIPLGVMIWMLIGLFALPGQLNKLKKELADLDATATQIHSC